jgi:hypothetical protein
MSFRIRGFLLHLLASSLLALLAICIVFIVWYPAPLQKAVGVTDIFLILLGVDVVIGPLLTLAVCKEGKKTLMFDLGFIIALQISAFAYGFFTIAQGRPVWIVFNKDRFDLVQAFEMNHIYRDKASEEFQKLSFTGPRWVAVRELRNEDRKTIGDALFAGVDIPQRADLYESYKNSAKLVSETAHNLDELTQYNTANFVKSELLKWPQADSFLPLKTREQSMVVLLKRKTGEIVAIIPLRPFE